MNVIVINNNNGHTISEPGGEYGTSHSYIYIYLYFTYLYIYIHYHYITYTFRRTRVSVLMCIICTYVYIYVLRYIYIRMYTPVGGRPVESFSACVSACSYLSQPICRGTPASKEPTKFCPEIR